MKNKSTSLPGALLKMERLRQNKGQKEVCLCLPEYGGNDEVLCKVEGDFFLSPS